MTLEDHHDQERKEHGLPLVRTRCRGSGNVLRQDLSRFICRRGASRTGRLPFGQARGCIDCRVYRDGYSLLGAERWTAFKHNEAFSFQVATEDQAETNRYWNAIVGNDGQESECGWCKDKWGISWQITPIALTKAYTSSDRSAAKRAFDAMMTMKKIDVAVIEAAVRR
ncbi:VOC family protein [Billgrantia sp. Q4P2]|uniref:VOC family protein n=1 Tax=Billgrantia sp. Q4P2 TaxID=3463857 RepID=UPI004055C67D